jgi:hypothetical protein
VFLLGSVDSELIGLVLLPFRAEGRRDWTLEEIDSVWVENSSTERWLRQVDDIPLCKLYNPLDIERFIISIGSALQSWYALISTQTANVATIRLLLTLPHTTHASGMPAHLLEYHLDKFTKASGLSCRMFITPMGTFYYFDAGEYARCCSMLYDAGP